jgi:hypothetical protein
MHPISKKSLAGKKRRISKKRSNDALKTALDITADATTLMLDLYECVIGSVADYDQAISEISLALDPKQSVEDNNKLSAIHLDFTATLAPDQVNDLARLLDAYEQVSFWREAAAFYLGAATAAQLRTLAQQTGGRLT